MFVFSYLVCLFFVKDFKRFCSFNYFSLLVILPGSFKLSFSIAIRLQMKSGLYWFMGKGFAYIIYIYNLYSPGAGPDKSAGQILFIPSSVR